MSIITFFIKNIFRKKIRLILTVLGIAVGIATCIIMLGLSEGIRGTLRSAYINRNIDIVIFEKDEFNMLSSRIDASLAGKISAFNEVESASGVLLDFVKYEKTYLPLYGWPPKSPLFNKIEVEGKLPRMNHKEVIVGNIFAKFNNKQIGDQIHIKRTIFDIVGVFKSAVPFEKSSLIIPISTMRQLSRDDKGKLLGLNITVKESFKNTESIQVIIDKLEKAFPAITAQSADVFAAEKTKQIILGEKIAALIVIITIIAVILGLANNVVTSVFERRKLIGLLVILGWHKKDVLKVLFLETLCLSVLGGAAGLFVGFFSTDYVFNMVATNIFTPTWNYVFVLKILGIILMTALVSAFASSWIIVQMNPLEVIKSE